MKKLALIAIFFSHTCWAISPWGKGALEHLRSFKLDIEDPYVSTLWGSCGEPNPIIIGDEKMEVLEGHFKKPLEVKLRLQKYPGFSPRPLVVVIPGIFVQLNGTQSRSLSKMAFKSGAHVLTFPNPLSVDYIAKGPRQKPADMEAEGRTIYKGVLEILDRLKKRNIFISEVKLVGVSYGAFVGAIVAAADAEDRQVISNSYLFNPPFYMYQTMKNLDKLLDENQDRFAWSKFGFILPYMQICWKEKHDGKDIENARHIITQEGFHAWLYKSIEAYQKVNNDPQIPAHEWGALSPKYRAWYKGLRFISFTTGYAPKLVEKLKSAKGKILHWTRIVESKSKSKVHILSSDDDFLNAPSVWPQNKGVILLKNGGHFGIRGMPWFKKFLDIALRESYVKKI